MRKAFSDLKMLWLRERFRWMGKHSGYDQVFEAINKLNFCAYYSVCSDYSKPLPRKMDWLLGYIQKRVPGSKFYSKHSVLSEIKSIFQCLNRRCNLMHVAFIGNNLGILGKYGRFLPSKIIGTVHQPSSWWNTSGSNPRIVEQLDALIVLSKREIAYFTKYLPGRVFFIPHGIDTDFFHPPLINVN